jgi:hypothetical protein
VPKNHPAGDCVGYPNILDFRFELMPAKWNKHIDLKKYNQVFQCWHEQWQETLSTLQPGHQLYSDCFTRQDCIATLFYKEQCISLAFLRQIDLGVELNLKDSFFKFWTAAATEKIKLNYSAVYLCSNFTVHKDWRGAIGKIRIKKLLMGLILMHLQKQNDVEAILAAVRCDRGMHNLSYEFSARAIEQNVKSPFNDFVDLVVYDRNEIDLGDSFSKNLVEQIWMSTKFFNIDNIQLRRVA